MTFPFHVDDKSIADAGDELSIQIRIRKAIKEQLRGVRFVAVPNGSERSAWASIKASHEGMASGFPDGIVVWSGGCAYVEVKTATGSLAPNQIEWLNWLHAAGHNVGCFRSAASCIDFLVRCGAQPSSLYAPAPSAAANAGRVAA